MKSNNLNINRQIVISNQINEARFKMNRAEQKLFLYCIGSVDNQADVLNTKFRMSVKDFAEFLELKSNKVYDEMIKTTANMASRVIQFAKPDGKFHQIPVLAEVIYDKGEIEIEVNRNLAPYLIDLKSNFTKFSLQEVLSFRSVYSMRIYQLLCQWNYQERAIYSIKELRFMLDIEPEEYKLYSNFKMKVLEIAYKEINQSSTMQFSYQEIKTGRKVTDINFIIKKITKPKVKTEAKKSVILEVEPTTNIQALPENTSSEFQLRIQQEPEPETLPPVYKRLIALGYSSQNALNLISTNPHDFLEYIFEKSKIEDRQKIINRAGYYGTLIAQYRAKPAQKENMSLRIC
jgi:plasmid replication initiation protein